MKRLLHPYNLMRFITIGIVSIVVFTSVLYFLFRIDLLVYLPKIYVCPFHALLGKPCPGCGMTRSFLLLGQLKFSEAIKTNPFSLFMFFIVLIYAIKGKLPSWVKNRYFLTFILFTVILFGFIRIVSS